MKIYSITWWEAFLERIYLLVEGSGKLRQLAAGYLSAIIVGVINENRHVNLCDYWLVIKEDFCRVSIYNIIFYLILAFFVLSLIFKYSLESFFKHRKITDRIIKLFKKHVDVLFSNIEYDGIGWGLGHTLMPAPIIKEGWKTRELQFEVNLTQFCFRTLGGDEMEQAYQRYLKDEFGKKFTEDGVKFMLTAKPVAYTDAKRLPIKLQKVLWSQLQFFWHYVYPKDPARYINMIFKAKRISHPNSFCLHLIVATSDDKILVTRASSHKSNDYPSSWSVSIGEQINWEDIANPHEDSGFLWVKRALNEELSLTEETFLAENIRYLSVNVEGDIGNCAFACLVELNIDSDTLRSVLLTENRMDNEFQEIKFMTLDDIPGELISPTLEYHPSAPMRMIDVYMHCKGIASLHERLLDATHKQNRKT